MIIQVRVTELRARNWIECLRLGDERRTLTIYLIVGSRNSFETVNCIKECSRQRLSGALIDVIDIF